MDLEKMDEFFNKRVNMYDDHMLNEVEGCREGYKRMAEQIPDSTKKLLDLGCGTGLELDKIFRRLPDVEVTGIDLSKGMLDRLREKYNDKKIKLIQSHYFGYNFGIGIFDTAISFQTLHHFSHEEKTILYTKIYKSLNSRGLYIECDYMANTQEEEDFYFAENKRLRSEMGIKGGFYHYDTPCTIDNQIKMLNTAGFKRVEKLWQQAATVLLVAQK